MDLDEKGLADSLRRMEETLGALEGRGARAWGGASVTTMSRLLDAVAPAIPRRTGELAGSGFVQRDVPVVAGWGAPHAAGVHELGGHRGFKFHQRVMDAHASKIPEMMADLHERYMLDGTTAKTAPASWPEIPVTRARSPAQRRSSRPLVVRAGAGRRRR